MLLFLALLQLAASFCGGCETDEDIDDFSYCMEESGPGADGTLYVRCYKTPYAVPALSAYSICDDDPYYCDHHGMGCAADGGCRCPDLPSGAACQRFPMSIGTAIQPSAQAVSPIIWPAAATIAIPMVFVNLSMCACFACAILCYLKRTAHNRDAPETPANRGDRTVDVVVQEAHT